MSSKNSGHITVSSFMLTVGMEDNDEIKVLCCPRNRLLTNPNLNWIIQKIHTLKCQMNGGPNR